MPRSRLFAMMLACLLPLALLPSMAHAQYDQYHQYNEYNNQYNPYDSQPNQYHPVVFLGTAHVDHSTDHKTIQVGHQAGSFNAIMLQVVYAPVQFDHVVIHYDDGTSQAMRVRAFAGPGSRDHWIRLPGEQRYIHSVELWFARSQPDNPVTPEVVLYGMP